MYHRFDVQSRYLAPVAVRAVDLTEPLPDLTDVSAYATVRLFLMWAGHPFASVDVPNHHGPLSAAAMRDAIVEQCAGDLLKATLRHGLVRCAEQATPDRRIPPAGVSVSIIVATYDRPDELRNCLHHLQTQRCAREVEIVVVDNHPASGLTPPVVAQFPSVTLVQEPRQGLAYARNAGFLAAKGDILVCTDDDVTTPAGWLETLVAPFAAPDVVAVTGNILPLELETPAQLLFEASGGLGRGFRPRSVDGTWFRRFRGAVQTWSLGATANAAFRASIFALPEIGLMDEALGPGTPTGVGEDTYLFYRVLKAGHALIYEPAAYVWHRHRRDMRALRRQLYRYSKGHVAYLLTTLLREGDRRALVRLGVSLPLWHAGQLARWATARVRGQRAHPLALVLLEIAGSLSGPWCLWRSRRRVRREGRSGPYLAPAPSGSVETRDRPRRAVLVNQQGCPVGRG